MHPDYNDISSNSVSDLSAQVSRPEKDSITEEHLKLITRRAAQALQFLHSANIVHRNICPEHILVNSCRRWMCASAASALRGHCSRPASVRAQVTAAECSRP